jgi:hypothetical protein
MIAAAFLKGRALDNALDQFSELAVVFIQPFRELLEGGGIVVLHTTTNRIRKEFFR